MVNERGCVRDSGLGHPGKFLGNHRPAEIVALRIVALESLKKFQVFLRFDAVGNDPQLQAALFSSLAS
jgi:hypothetical protein